MTFRQRRDEGRHYGKKSSSKSRHPHYDYVPSAPEGGREIGKIPHEYLEARADRLGKSKLHAAIIKADAQAVEALLLTRFPKYGAVDFVFEEGRTPLTFALSTLVTERLALLAGSGGSEQRADTLERIVKSILFYGADVNRDDGLNELPLTLAFSCGRELVEHLLAKSANPEYCVDASKGKKKNVPLLSSPFERLLGALKQARAGESPAAQNAAAQYEELARLLAFKFEVPEKSPLYPAFWQLREDAKTNPVKANWTRLRPAVLRAEFSRDDQQQQLQGRPPRRILPSPPRRA